MSPIQKFGTPKLTADTFNLVEFGVFVIWWQKRTFYCLKFEIIKYVIAPVLLT